MPIEPATYKIKKMIFNHDLQKKKRATYYPKHNNSADCASAHGLFETKKIVTNCRRAKYSSRGKSSTYLLLNRFLTIEYGTKCFLHHF